MAKKELTLNEAFTSVEEIMEKLRDDEISLEDSFKLYKEGMDMLKVCSEKIDKVEKQVKMLDEDGEVSDFQTGTGE
ncbi:MAG: exodeoxyribonuclease VII small subunit [Lachnospiraceae bacterium]|nr:exodeoxyribonuclease VII small subunit [Lachnospiraceae bacterium]